MSMKLLTPPKALLLLAAPIPVPPSDGYLDSVREELDEACFYFELLEDSVKVDVCKLLDWYCCFRNVEPAWKKMEDYLRA